MANGFYRFQGNIFSHHTVPQFSVPADIDAGRNFQPDFPGSQHTGHFRRPDTCTKTAKGAISGTVGIGPNHQRTWQHMAPVHHYLMAGSREFIIIADAVGCRPVSRVLYNVGLLDIGRRRIMVRNNDHLIRIPDRHPHLFQIVGNLHTGSQQIVHHGAIHFRPDDLAGLNNISAGSMSQNFLTDCHAHCYIPPHLILLS